MWYWNAFYEHIYNIKIILTLWFGQYVNGTRCWDWRHWSRSLETNEAYCKGHCYRETNEIECGQYASKNKRGWDINNKWLNKWKRGGNSKKQMTGEEMFWVALK